MTAEGPVITNENNQVERIPTREEIRFCEGGVETMCRFYGVAKSDFEQRLQEGFLQVRYGRGQLNYHDTDTDEYNVAFAAFVSKNSHVIETLEVRKIGEVFGDVTKGLSNRLYSPDEYKKIVREFKLILVTEDLADFIKRFNWS